MSFNEIKNGYGESIVYRLKELYEGFGYAKFKMSKFEEYDLYVRNKSFLVSDHILTFTDTDGKLMALKPDVTLSIVKNSPESEQGVRKVYYNENVYRVPRGALSFKEIMQTGLECIGDIDELCVCEVLLLAARSLALVSEDYVLDVSHMGIVSALTDSIGLSARGKAQLLSCIGEKNVHGIDAVCASEGIDCAKAETLKRLMAIKGDPSEMLEILADSECFAEAEHIAQIVDTLRALGGKVNLDFSVTDDMKYYSGVVFKGFVKGVPTSVLSGGRYDNLMKKMGKASGAIGFAVYLDLLAELYGDEDEYDADVLVLYDGATDPCKLLGLTDGLVREGKSVETRKEIPERKTYKEIVDMRGKK
jgi:ATP phosphoribosyltransferase regulatory subunit